MKAKVKSLTMLIVALIVAVITVGYAFAWFFDNKKAEFVINGESAGAYFAGGTGTKSDPFIITNATHIYNLAWLQDTGRFGTTTKYYFEVDNDFTVPEGVWVPPIGNDKYPFIGEFDGNGHTITNLKVTTNKEKLTNFIEGTTFSNAVGMFGMTDNLNDESDTSVITNFILANPWVEVPAVGEYGTENAAKSAGIAIGHVEGKASSIGVLANKADASGTYLDVQRSGYSTFNSILGALGQDVTSSVTGGGHGTGGSGAAFGASFDVEGMYERLEKIDANKSSSTPSWRLPGLGSSSSDGITLGSLEKLPFTVTAESKYTGVDDGEVVAANNIGYLLGNQNKVYKKNVTFGDKLIEQSDGKWTFPDGKNPSSGKIPRWIYRFNAQNVSSDVYDSNSGFSALSDAEYEALPQGIKDLIPEQNGQVSGFQSVRMSQTYQNVGGQIYPGSTSNGQWSPHGQISWNGNTYGEGFRGTTVTAPENNKIQDAVDENGVRYTADGNYLDDNNYEYYVDSDGRWVYLPSDSNFSQPIYTIDANGYGLNSEGYYFYSGALDGTIYEDSYWDENGYLYSPTKKYFVELDWNFGEGTKTIDADGYVLKDGERVKDKNNKDVLAYGYEFEEVTNNGNKEIWLKNEDGYIEIDRGGWYSHPTTIKTSNDSGKVKAKTGTTVALHRFTKGIALPNCGIWFKPIAAGKIEIVMYSETSGDGFALIKGHRANATKENPFYINYSSGGSGLTSEEIGKYTLPKNVLFYYEFEVTEEDIADGRYEYWLMQYGSGGAFFVYMDLGASAANDTSVIDRTKAVSAIDFIYNGVEIKQGDPANDAADAQIKVGDFIVKPSGTTEELYKASKTSVYFENIKSVLKIVYIRLNEDTESKHSGKTICLEKSTPVPDTNSEVKATNPTYVCPTIGSGSGGGGGSVVDPDPPTPGDVKVTSVTLSGAPSTMTVGGTAALSATVAPDNATDKTVTWSSSNESIATVDASGNITAKAAGDVIITATANDGSGKSASVTITVEDDSGVVYPANGTFSVADGTLSKSLTLASDGIEMSSNSYDTSTTATWSGTINGASVNFGTCMRAGGNNGRYIAINVKAGTKISVAFGGNYATNNASASMWIGESSSTAQDSALASQTTVNVGKTSASGLLEYTATADGTYYIIFDTTKPVIFAIVLS